MIKYIVLVILSFAFNVFNAEADIPVLSDSAKVSILTNAPWQEEVYAVFGHTAIRVKDTSQNIDYVFNYGLFDFNSPNFIYRFVKGQTDYMVGVSDFSYYLEDYSLRGVLVVEQILNLQQVEKQNIWNALCINTLPQNRKYRYNFFFDNCSTRPRDIIEQNVIGEFQYTETKRTQTFRDLIHECVSLKPWVKFGIDLVIGSDADLIATEREKMFLPIYLKNAYDGATIQSNNMQKRIIVLSESVILPSKNIEPKTPLNYPLIVGLITFIIIGFISYLTYYKGFIFIGKFVDLLLFTSAGLAGSIITFLMFVSEHPCTNNNWNIVWLNPIQLFAAILFFAKYFSKAIYYYHFINFAILSIFLLLWIFIPQQLELAFIPFILSIWLRSGMNIIEYKKLKQPINRLGTK